MKKNLLFKIICIICFLSIVVSLFLPFIDKGYYSVKLFDNAESLYYIPYIIIGISIFSIILVLLNKKLEICLLFDGYFIAYSYSYTMIYKDSFKSLSYGYYMFTISPLILLVMLVILLMNDKRKDELNITQSTNESSNNQQIQDSNEVINMQPSELAQSIMDKPVMKDIVDDNMNVQSIIDNNQLDINSNEQNNIDNIQNLDDINIEFADNVTLSPNNPLSSFLPSDFDLNSINNVEKEETTSNAEIIDSNTDEKKSENNESIENNGQSILSIMAQPMVSQTPYGNNLIANIEQNNSIPQAPVQSVAEPSIPQAPVQQVVEPGIPQAPVQSVVEPSIPQAPVQQVVEPSIPQAPVQQVVEPSIPQVPVQPDISIPLIDQSNASDKIESNITNGIPDISISANGSIEGTQEGTPIRFD